MLRTALQPFQPVARARLLAVSRFNSVRSRTSSGPLGQIVVEFYRAGRRAHGRVAAIATRHNPKLPRHSSGETKIVLGPLCRHVPGTQTGREQQEPAGENGERESPVHAATAAWVSSCFSTWCSTGTPRPIATAPRSVGETPSAFAQLHVHSLVRGKRCRSTKVETVRRVLAATPMKSSACPCCRP